MSTSLTFTPYLSTRILRAAATWRLSSFPVYIRGLLANLHDFGLDFGGIGIEKPFARQEQTHCVGVLREGDIGAGLNLYSAVCLFSDAFGKVVTRKLVGVIL